MFFSVFAVLLHDSLRVAGYSRAGFERNRRVRHPRRLPAPVRGRSAPAQRRPDGRRRRRLPALRRRREPGAAGSTTTWPVRLAVSTVPSGAVYDPARAGGRLRLVRPQRHRLGRRDHGDDHRRQDDATDDCASTPQRRSARAAGGDHGRRRQGDRRGHHGALRPRHPRRLRHLPRRPRRLRARSRGSCSSTSPLDVIIGAGHPWYDDGGRRRQTGDVHAYVGDAALWDDLAAGRLRWTLITAREQFLALAQGPTPPRVVGLPPVYETCRSSAAATRRRRLRRSAQRGRADPRRDGARGAERRRRRPRRFLPADRGRRRGLGQPPPPVRAA